MLTQAIIYIVDDSDEQLDIAMKMLIKAGYKVRTYNSGEEFLRDSKIESIGCVLLDNQMPGLSGLDVQIELKRLKVDLPIVFMSGNSVYGEVVTAIQKGALGFLQKPYTMVELIDQIKIAVDESVRRFDANQSKSTAGQVMDSLTPREKQVYKLVIGGHTSKAISELLSITVGTVEFHRANVMKKLDVRTLADLIATAIREKS